MGCKIVGSTECQTKNHLIMETHQHRYKQFISDLSGRDIAAHGNRVEDVINIVRNWLNDAIKDTTRYPLPGGDLVYKEYRKFRRNLPMICDEFQLEVRQVTESFNDYSFIVAQFIKARAEQSKKAQQR